MSKARIAIVGVGNCASSLVQGIHYYTQNDSTEGLIRPEIGGMAVSDIEVVAAFDVDERKVGKDLSEAIWLGNNNAMKLAEVPALGVTVSAAPRLDGLGRNYAEKVEQTVEAQREEIVGGLEASGAEIIVNYLPVGSAEASRFWADMALESGCAFVNCIPEFIASDASYRGMVAATNYAIGVTAPKKQRQKALEALKAAAREWLSLGNGGQAAEVLLRLGKLQADGGYKNAGAVTTFERALKALGPPADARQLALAIQVGIQKGQAELEAKAWTEARSTLRTLIEWAIKANDDYTAAWAYSGLAQSLLKQGKRSEAIDALKTGRAYASKAKDKELLSLFETNLQKLKKKP